MSTTSYINEKTVYLALRDIFKDQDAEVRQIRAIRRLITIHQGRENVAELVNICGMDVLCDTARALLRDGVFASASKASQRFPELCHSTHSPEMQYEDGEVWRRSDLVRYTSQVKEDKLPLPKYDLGKVVTG